MASRIFWVMIAVLALVTGMVLQDGVSIFGWNDRVSERVERAVDRSVDQTIDRTVDRTIDRMQVVDSDGREIAADSDAKRALGEAVGRLVKAEADLAVLKVRDGAAEDIQAASTRRDQARAEVETLKAQIEEQDRLAQADGATARDEIRDEIRDTVRDAVRN
jgi:hypothetical protein